MAAVLEEGGRAEVKVVVKAAAAMVEGEKAEAAKAEGATAVEETGVAEMEVAELEGLHRRRW